MRARSAACIVALVLGVSVPAGAQGPDGPALRGHLELSLQSDIGLAGGRRREAFFSEVELSLEASLGASWYVDVGLVFEPVEEATGSSPRFAPHGGYVETLALRFEGPRGWMRLGKLTPRFGRGWDVAAGIYGSDLAEDYELAERWGIEFGGRLDSERWGLHELAVSGSFADTTLLSRSLFSDRGRNRTRDGGPANTSRPDSVALSLDGTNPGPLKGLRYHAAFTRQGRGRSDPRRESGLVLGLAIPVPLPAGVEATAFVEHARVFDAGGVPGNASYTTTSLELGRGGWFAALAMASRHRSGLDPVRDRVVEVSAGYRFESGLELQLGWRGAREHGITSHGLGVRIRRRFDVAS